MAKVLVVDDEPLIAVMLAEWLAEQGHEPVGPAHTEAQALDLLGSTHIDVAILDVGLGDGDCRRVAQALRDQHVTFAFATGRMAEHVPPGFADVDVLPKPFSFATIERALDELLQAAHSG